MKIYTDPRTSTAAERRGQPCKCGVCGLVDRCTPKTDFYVRGDETFLRCARCVLIPPPELICHELEHRKVQVQRPKRALEMALALGRLQQNVAVLLYSKDPNARRRARHRLAKLVAENGDLMAAAIAPPE